MSSVILEAHDLTKEYRHTVALDHIDLKIEKGKIYGFIGQNGAGKTTFLRLVTGLAFPTSGTLSLWGKTVEKELQEQRKRIGCMIETPALFPTMTAYQNMEIQRIQRGIPDKAVIQKTLDMVGLKDTGKKAVRNFSLGMRQRLGIAIALVSNHQFNWWFIISPPKGYCYCSPQRAVSQALLLARYKAVLLESSRLYSSACSFIYF